MARPPAGGGEPGEELVGVAKGGGQGDALNLPTGEATDPLHDGEKVPAPVVAGEGVSLVDDDGLHVGEPTMVVDPAGDEHRLDRLGRGEQDVGRLGEEAVALGLAGVAVPETDAAPHQAPVALEAEVEVVEQRPQGTDVQHAESPPVLAEHARQQREHGGFGLAAGGGCHGDGVVAGEDGFDGGRLERSQ